MEPATSRPAPTHAARPPRPRTRVIAAICGALAAMAAVGVGVFALLNKPEQVSTTPTSANLITVAPRIPLTDREIAALVNGNPEFGDLANLKRRASCLNGLGYPAAMQVLGAQPVRVNGQSAVVLVLPGDHPNELLALAVTPSCNAAGTGLIASTTVTRP